MRSPRSPSPSGDPEFWRAHVTAWTRSGLSARAYAAEHNLKAPTLYAWRRRLRHEPSTRSAPRLVPITLEAPALCELVLRDGRTLRFPTHVEPAALAAFLRVVEAS